MPGIGKTRIVYRPREGATPEDAVAALASVYSFVLCCAQKERRAGVGPTLDARKGVNNDPDTSSIPE
jgi:hypothetical protein